MVPQEIINFAHHLADLSEGIAKKYFRQNSSETAKDDDSPVTKADREIEKVLREEIEKKFPTHGIIGEEFGVKLAQNIEMGASSADKLEQSQNPNSAGYTWILDPIDGTSSFIIGRAIFGTLIALAYDKKPILGIMNQPIAGERWIGIEGDGTYFNGKKIRTRNCSEISNAVLCSSSPHHFRDADEKVLTQLRKSTKYQRLGGAIYGGDCYSYASLASGFVDAVIDCGLQVYDYAALIPIIKMAGGVVSDWSGNDLELKSDVHFLACGDAKLHQEILALIAKNKR